MVNADSSYTFSGPTPFVIGAYPWSLTSPSYGSTFEVNLPDEQYIRIGTYGGSSGSIYVEVRATNTSSIFGGSVGMSGNFNLELLTDRIGNDLGSDGALAAAAWTWNSGLDPQLLGDSANGSCSPPLAGANGCVARDGACQGEGKCVACLAPGAAATACTNTGLEGPELTNCIYDVQTTGDVVTWPNAVFYTQCFDGGTACKDHGGECVVNCQKGGYFGPYCEKSLCGDGSGASGCACRLPKKLWTR